MSSVTPIRLVKPGAEARDTDFDRTHAAQVRFWRSLDELAGQQPPASGVDAPVSPERRDWLKWMGASLALAGSACSRPPRETIVPYATSTDQTNDGKPVFYASAIARDGYGCGVLVEINMGRPSKIEGNPLHPASLGATDAITQGAVLELWDPDRSQVARRAGAITTFETFVQELSRRVETATDGRGVRILTETVLSPSLHATLKGWLERHTQARWHQYQPINRDNVYDGARLAYGVALEPRYRFADARVVVALDADILGAMPGSVRYARDLASRRDVAQLERMSRLYVAEGAPSLTGAYADHRRITRASDVPLLTRALALKVIGPGSPAPSADPATDAWLDAAAADLLRHRGESVVVAGDRQPPVVHAMVHRINEALNNVGGLVELGAPAAFNAENQVASLMSLTDAMRNGDVETLIVLGGNPVYQAPADLAFADALSHVPWSAHHSLYHDETSTLCLWHVPAAHVLETWGDIRAYDGTVTIQQPCIDPLYAGQSAHALLAGLRADHPRTAYDAVRSYWSSRSNTGFDEAWNKALWSGVASPATPPLQASLDHHRVANVMEAMQSPPSHATELVFAPDPTLGDGRHANNAWLQELPKPISTLTWDNAVLMSPRQAERMALHDEDVIALRADGRRLEAPVLVTPGHADRSVTVYLGGGRTRAGRVGNHVGFDTYAVRTSAHFWIAPEATLTKTDRRYPLAFAQTHHRMEGRDLVRMISREEALRCNSSGCNPAPEPTKSLYPPFSYDGYKWGMSINLASCIGCSACTIACQSENNIAVVGKEEVRNGRELHWIRVDRYYTGTPDAVRTVFQPVPCMQCEHAPCEEVCPVEASVHDAEGLNVQVYNRCVGTRFCSNNCPYKVRRFNFLDYTRKATTLAAQRNPEVTVRMRGVMEKCSYCVQRIANARSLADRESRRIRDGEVVTACQAVCPTGAIVFGDLNDPASAVTRRKASPLDYALLAELNTRPRTSYMPKLTNANPAAGPGSPRDNARE